MKQSKVKPNHFLLYASWHLISFIDCSSQKIRLLRKCPSFPIYWEKTGTALDNIPVMGGWISSIISRKNTSYCLIDNVGKIRVRQPITKCRLPEGGRILQINPSLIPDNYFQQFLGVFVGLTVCLSATAS